MADNVRAVLDDVGRTERPPPPKNIPKKPKNKGCCCFWGDDNVKRGNWSGRLEFFLSCLGFSIGLGDIWRFPFLVYKNGGAAFFIPCLLLLILIGLPLILAEFAIGQFCSRGVLNCWGYAPFFRGIGAGMLLLSAMIAVYHNALVGGAMRYLVASMARELPWAKCRCKSNPMCNTRLQVISLANCTAVNGLKANLNNGTCYDKDGNLYGIFNWTVAKGNNLTRRMPAKDYFEQEGFMTGVSKGIGDLKWIRWDMALCLLVAWILIMLFLIKGIKSMGKVAYVTTILPILIILTLTIVAAISPGSGEGLKLLMPKMERLGDLKVWCEAAIMVFYLIGVCWGGLLTLASFNRFHTDIVRYTFIVPAICFAVYVVTAVMFFAFLGIVLKHFGQEALKCITSSLSFAFVIVPQAVAMLPGAVAWSILFFTLLVCLGLSTVMVLVLTIVTALTDSFRSLRSTLIRILTLLLCCLVLFLLGLPLTTVGGAYVLQLMDDYVIWWSVEVLALVLIVSFVVYGPLRLSRDVEVMGRKKCCCCIPWSCCKWVWILGWMILAPVCLLFGIIICLLKYTGSQLGSYKYPTWANIIGWAMTVSILLLALIVFIVCAARSGCKCAEMLRPTRRWGPALLKDRKHVTYAEGFVVDPKEDQEVPEDMQYAGMSNPYSNSVYENEGADL